MTSMPTCTRREALVFCHPCTSLTSRFPLCLPPPLHLLHVGRLEDVDVPLPDVQLSPGHSADPSPSPETPGPSTSSATRHTRTHRSGGARDDRYRSGTLQNRSQTQVMNRVLLMPFFHSYGGATSCCHCVLLTRVDLLVEQKC